MTGRDPSEVTTQVYRDIGMAPSIQTIYNWYPDWETALDDAANQPQEIPSNLSSYYRSVAALRRVRDLQGYPVTGAKYRRLSIQVPMHEILSPFRSFTQAKVVAGVHSEGDP